MVIVALTGILFLRSTIFKAETAKTGDLRILKSQVSSKAKFYHYTVDGVKIEVVAVKASDGSIRTAFNTCQICFDSGRGWYVMDKH